MFSTALLIEKRPGVPRSQKVEGKREIKGKRVRIPCGRATVMEWSMCKRLGIKRIHVSNYS